VTEAWVINASPLILFARIARLELIERLAPTILIPKAVIQEVRAGRERDSTANTAVRWAEQYGVDDVALVPAIEHWDLGPGESQVIAHSLGHPRWAVLDDRAARRCAVAHGVTVIGSLGIVLRSKRSRQIDQARTVVDALIAAGMFLDDELVERLLAGVGE
jgi:predicted nucleic acid-binding protein